MTKRKILKTFIGFTSGILGLAILAYVLVPLVSYQAPTSTRLKSYLSPVPEEALASSGESIDYTKASTWFEGDEAAAAFEVPSVRYYTLTIPKLKIKNATVAIGGEDLSDSLIQYPGTALPGKRGNAVIFGHSILPQFYNPKDYLSIFSTLPSLRKGDEIQISYDGIDYEYIVEDAFEVKPTDLEILAQNTSDSFTTLITCTPPGHPLRPKRLIVRARLNPYGNLSSL